MTIWFLLKSAAAMLKAVDESLSVFTGRAKEVLAFIEKGIINCYNRFNRTTYNQAHEFAQATLAEVNIPVIPGDPGHSYIFGGSNCSSHC